MTAKSRTAWTFAVTSAALFMASLDNLVVTTALPSIRAHLPPVRRRPRSRRALAL